LLCSLGQSLTQDPFQSWCIPLCSPLKMTLFRVLISKLFKVGVFIKQTLSLRLAAGFSGHLPHTCLVSNYFGVRCKGWERRFSFWQKSCNNCYVASVTVGKLFHMIYCLWKKSCVHSFTVSDTSLGYQ
jgi:hypothetical protein